MRPMMKRGMTTAVVVDRAMMHVFPHWFLRSSTSGATKSKHQSSRRVWGRGSACLGGILLMVSLVVG